MTVHPILERQIRKYLPEGFDIDLLQPFLQAVNSRYESQERDKQLSEHAFAISEREYQDVYQNLKEQNEISRQSVEKLKCALSKLDQRFSANYDDASDLMRVVNDITTLAEQTRILKIELESAKESAEQLAKAKGNFLSVMSHEIRTPLNAIIGNIHLLEGEPYLQEQESLLRSLRISSHSLLSLINDILDFSKIEAGKLHLEKTPFDLRELVGNTVKSLALTAENKGLDLHAHIAEAVPVRLVGDPNRLRQILLNLLGNALKFTERGQVTLDVALEAQSAGQVSLLLTVADTGIGIPTDKLESIFRSFEQVDASTTRKYGGTGLGLSICSQLINLMGGSIYVESEPGVGSQFHFTVRLGVLPQPRRLSESQLRALVVDDNLVNQRMATLMLEKSGFQVQAATSGPAAVLLCEKAPFDVVLLDMPRTLERGLAVARELRQLDQREGRHTPLLAMSAQETEEVRQACLAAGLDEYLTKPLHLPELQQKLGRVRAQAEQRAAERACVIV